MVKLVDTDGGEREMKQLIPGGHCTLLQGNLGALLLYKAVSEKSQVLQVRILSYAQRTNRKGATRRKAAMNPISAIMHRMSTGGNVAGKSFLFWFPGTLKNR